MKAILRIFRNFLDKPTFRSTFYRMKEKGKPLKLAYHLGFRGFQGWWSKAIEIRTESHKNIRQRDGLRSIFIVVSKGKVIIKYINRVEKSIYHLTLIFLIVWISIFELFDPFYNVLAGILGTFQFCLQNTDF